MALRQKQLVRDLFQLFLTSGTRAHISETLSSRLLIITVGKVPSLRRIAQTSTSSLCGDPAITMPKLGLAAGFKFSNRSTFQGYSLQFSGSFHF
jgi:hypothetical protein